MSELKTGWYWVRHGHEQSTWEAAEWNGARWRLVGSDDMFSELEVPVVGPRIPTPDEPWKCVPVQPTRKMRQAGDIAKNDCYIEGIYADMLYTAPKP